MKKNGISDNLMLVGTKRETNGKREIVYYIRNNKVMLYAFTRKYSMNTYDLVKSGIRVNELMYLRTRDVGVMNLVKYSKRLIPYLVDFYDLKVA